MPHGERAMSTRKDTQRDDSAGARADAAEESSAAQPTHYHSRMEGSTSRSQARAPKADGDSFGGETRGEAVAEEATTRRVTPEFFRRWGVADLSRKSDYWLGKQGRVTRPAVLRRGATHYEPIDWDEAFKLVAEELNSLTSPDEAAFYTSGRTSNEAAFLYQLFVRQFGTNNLPDCSNMCHESSGRALTETIGVGKGTVTLDDFQLAEAIFVVGQNPGTCHPRMLTSLH